MNLLLNVLGSSGVVLVLLAAVGWFCREWILTTLRSAIASKYAHDLEAFKAELRRDQELALEQLKNAHSKLRSIQDAVAGTFGQMHAVAQERRLTGIEAVWSAVVAVRSETPVGLVLADAFPEEEYNRLFFGTPELQTFIRSIDAKALPGMAVARGSEVENWRPFVGEYIYSLYEAYRTLTLRVYVETALGVASGEVSPWYRNDVNRALVSKVLTPEEFTEFDSSKTKFRYVRTAIESKIIAKSARIISGEASAAHMLEQGTQILQVVHQLHEAMQKDVLPK